MAYISANEFGLRMANLKKLARQGIVDARSGTLPFQGKLLLEKILSFTPAKSKEQQDHAIRNDLLNLFEIHRQETVDAAIKKLGRGVIKGTVWAHALVNLQCAGTVLTISEAKAVHKANYTSKGRTKRLAKGAKYLMPVPLFIAYREYLFQKSGKAKAGWIPAAGRLFAKIPNWVLRHAPGQGSYVDGLSAAKPFIEVRNGTRWASNSEANRIVNDAVASRIRAMKSYAVRAMALAAKGSRIK